MPFVIVNDQGFYLRRVSGKRSWIPKIDEATIWDKSGPAKNAAHHAARHDRASQVLLLQEVKLMTWGSHVAFTAKSPFR